MVAEPPITIVIPTRERHDTLVWALETCVTQEYENLHILVSDNHSEDGTRDVVASFAGDSRVEYIRTPSRLSMTENWEFALSRTTEGYVTFLGDDDGMMPGATVELAELLKDEEPLAVRWPVHSYYWPTYVDPSMANCLSMSLVNELRYHRVSSGDALARVAAFREHCHELPSLYWGVVHQEAIRRARRTPNSDFFRSITPDIYSAVAVASVCDHFLSTDKIFSLSGSSGHSTGASQVTGARSTDKSSPVQRFEQENMLAFAEDFDYAPSIPVLVAEALTQCRLHVSSDVPRVDIPKLIRAALTHPEYLFNPGVRDLVTSPLSRTAARHGYEGLFQDELDRANRLDVPRSAIQLLNNVVLGRPVFPCDASVSNIYEATLRARELLESATSRGAAWRATARGRALKATRVIRSARRRLAS